MARVFLYILLENDPSKVTRKRYQRVCARAGELLAVVRTALAI